MKFLLLLSVVLLTRMPIVSPTSTDVILNDMPVLFKMEVYNDSEFFLKRGEYQVQLLIFDKDGKLILKSDFLPGDYYIFPHKKEKISIPYRTEPSMDGYYYFKINLFYKGKLINTSKKYLFYVKFSRHRYYIAQMREKLKWIPEFLRKASLVKNEILLKRYSKEYKKACEFLTPISPSVLEEIFMSRDLVYEILSNFKTVRAKWKYATRGSAQKIKKAALNIDKTITGKKLKGRKKASKVEKTTSSIKIPVASKFKWVKKEPLQKVKKDIPDSASSLFNMETLFNIAGYILPEPSKKEESKKIPQSDMSVFPKSIVSAKLTNESKKDIRTKKTESDKKSSVSFKKGKVPKSPKVVKLTAETRIAKNESSEKSKESKNVIVKKDEKVKKNKEKKKKIEKKSDVKKQKLKKNKKSVDKKLKAKKKSSSKVLYLSIIVIILLAGVGFIILKRESKQEKSVKFDDSLKKRLFDKL